MRRDMSGNGLSELNGGVVAGEDDAVAGCHGEVVSFPKAIWRLGRLGSDAFCLVNLSGSRMTTPAARPAPGSHVARPKSAGNAQKPDSHGLTRPARMHRFARSSASYDAAGLGAATTDRGSQ